MKSVLYHWLKKNRSLLVNAFSLVGTTGITSILGFVYWWVADRLFSPHEVGVASAAVSAIAWLGTCCVLGLGTLLIGELPRHRGKEGSLISTSLLLVGGLSGICGVVFALIAPLLSPDFAPLRSSLGSVFLFAMGASLTTMVVVLDDAVVGLLRGELQFWRNALFAATKLVFLLVAGFWLMLRDSQSIYGAWIVALPVSLIPLIIVAVRHSGWNWRSALPDWSFVRKLGSVAMQHHILNLVLQAPLSAMPLIVTIVLSATANAWFYNSWMITGFVCTGAYALTTVLYAINADQADELARKMRLTLGLSLIAAIAGNALLFFGGREILSLLGNGYAENATMSLRILGLGAFPIIVRDHYVAVSRIYGRMRRVIPYVALGSVLELGIAAAGGHYGGLVWLSAGWVAAVCIEAIIMCGTVYKALYPRTGNVAVRKTGQLETLGVNGQQGATILTGQELNEAEEERYALASVTTQLLPKVPRNKKDSDIWNLEDTTSTPDEIEAEFDPDATIPLSAVGRVPVYLRRANDLRRRRYEDEDTMPISVVAYQRHI